MRSKLGSLAGSVVRFVNVVNAFVLVLLLQSCSGPSAVGTNTNWMRLCDEDAECGSENSCVCGRCTQPCSDPDSCAEDGENVVCAPPEATLLQCQGEGPRSCQPACTEHDDCAAGRLCHYGVCTDGLGQKPCPSGVLYCQDFENDELDGTQVVTSGNSLRSMEGPTPSGDGSLSAVIGSGPSVAYLRAPLPIQSEGTVFLSGWVRVPEEEAHDVAPLALWTSGEEDWALRLVIKDASLELWTKTTPHAGGIELQRGTWHCLQAAVTVADEGAVTVLVDGAVAATADAVDTLPEGGIEAVAMGTLWAGVGAEVRVDRVIVSNEPVDCYD